MQFIQHKIIEHVRCALSSTVIKSRQETIEAMPATLLIRGSYCLHNTFTLLSKSQSTLLYTPRAVQNNNNNTSYNLKSLLTLHAVTCND